MRRSAELEPKYQKPREFMSLHTTVAIIGAGVYA
jgi:hypothetical protein